MSVPDALLPGRRAALTTFLLLLALAGAGAAHGQVSPGPLSAPHAELEGNRNCTKCHGGGEVGQDRRCLECHRGIASLVERRRGLHGLEGRTRCGHCHPEHAGVDFELVDWGVPGREKFDHGRTGWPLEQKHAAAACDACHRPDRIADPAHALEPKPEALAHVGLDPRCTTCHEDAHRGALGDDCARCHDAQAFRPARNFDHAKTAFPLTGRHVKVRCDDCHLADRLRPARDAQGRPVPVYKPVPHASCADCHRDVHRGRLGTDCARCHVTDGFRVIRRGAFDHSRTRFPLRGAHARAKCAKCHGEGERRVADPRFDACAICHRDPHDGKATIAGRVAHDCIVCHDERAFKPSTFTVRDHAKTDYPLEGAHARTACAACHRPAVPPAGAPRAPGSDVRFRMDHARCTDCHEDAHGGQLASDGRPAPDCAECHDVAAFRPSRFGRVEHARLRLPLEGRHAGIECRACHGPDRRGLPALPGRDVLGRAGVAVRLDDARCASCHADPHDGRLTPAGTDCAACHGASTFRPSRYDAERHREARFRLEQAHRTVPCVLCHRELENRARPKSTLVAAPGRPAGGLTFAVAKQECRDCHDTPHGSQFDTREGGAACSTCHDQGAFRPASRFDHDRDARFALGKAHRKVACAECHKAPAEGRPVVYRPLDSRCRACHGPGRGAPALPDDAEGADARTGRGQKRQLSVR
ncbi:MAG: hypothetical protein Kow0062_16810 [Acidobacteriota bacterium]